MQNKVVNINNWDKIYAEIQNNNALLQIQNVLINYRYMPFTDSSLNYSSLAVVFNDIVINNRRIIVEFGSGTSTFLLANLLKINKINNAKVISIEHDYEWFTFVQKEINRLDLSEFVDLQHIGLTENELSLNGIKWYDIQKLLSCVENYPKIDCVLVDGPPAYSKEIEYARYPALPTLYKYLNDYCSIFLDDTNRKGESEIISKWSIENSDFEVESFNESFTGLFRGFHFNVRLPRVKL